MEMETSGEEETMALAARLGARAKGSALICLYGPLGSGKTTFARGFLRGLGHKGRVASPTFALVNEYGRLSPKVYHMDLYRVSSEDVGSFGFEEYLSAPDSVCLIEWPEAARGWLPADRLEVSIAYAGNRRRVRFKALGAKSRELLGFLKTMRQCRSLKPHVRHSGGSRNPGGVRRPRLTPGRREERLK